MKARPTKKHPYVCCTEGSSLNSVEPQDNIPVEVAAKPELPWCGNGIDFIYTSESCQWSCSLHFTKISVSTAEVATLRTPKAQAEQAISGMYVNCTFLYHNELMVVTNTTDNMATCRYVNNDSDDDEYDERDPIYLPMERVALLIASFGR